VRWIGNLIGVLFERATAEPRIAPALAASVVLADRVQLAAGRDAIAPRWEPWLRQVAFTNTA
jgi:hypothetical protein